MKQFKKIRKKRLKMKFCKKIVAYKIPKSGAFILKPDNVFYEKFEIKNEVFLLD